MAGKSCQAKNKRGKPCGGFAITGSKYCFAHDPSQARKRAKARKQGGINRKTPKRTLNYPGEISKTKDVVPWVNAALEDTWAQENSSQRSRTIGYLLGVAMKALEVGELEERLDEIEYALQMKVRNEA